MKRTCGECTACCTTHAVTELQKPTGTLCTHCDVGKGCQIYGSRPRECQKFQCSWLMGVGGDNYRPDKIGIVFEYRKDHPDIGVMMWFWEVKDGALQSYLIKSWTRRNLIMGNPVLQIPLVTNPKLYLSAGIPKLDKVLELGNFGRKIKVFSIEEAVYLLT